MYKDYKNTIGGRITRLLKERHLTQRELAVRAGITEVSMSRYINNRRVPKGTVIARIADVLCVPTDCLLSNVQRNPIKEDKVMSVFPVITKEKQQMYEDFCWVNNPISIPCICGYCGRACRQMGAKADTASCMECGLSVFVSVVEAIKKRCNEKQQTGIENLHDSDIFGIQEELKKKGVKAGTDYVKLILAYLIKEDNKMEYFDVVNEKGEPTGKVVTREEAHSQGYRHRTTHVWVVRKKDHKLEVLMQKRSSNKDSFPGQYDTSCAGHIDAGEDAFSAAMRELQEELGITATPEDLAFVSTFPIDCVETFHGKTFIDREVAFLYVYNKDVDITKLTLQEKEVESVAWFDINYVWEQSGGISQFCAPLGSLMRLREWDTAKAVSSTVSAWGYEV